MPWYIQTTGTAAEVTAAVAALTVPASEGALAESELAAAKVYIANRIASGGPLVSVGPLRLVAFGLGKGNTSVLRVDLSYVKLITGTHSIIHPPPNV